MNTKHLILHTKPVISRTTAGIATSYHLNLSGYIQNLCAARKADLTNIFNRADTTLMLPQT